MTKTPIETVISRLTGARKTPTGWIATCPAHDDSSPSLGLSEGDGGQALLICHAGCDTANVLAAVELTMADLFPRMERADRSIAATYDYRSEDGGLLFQVVRYDPKGFAQRRRVDGRWVWDLKGVRRVLYRLPELLAAPEQDVVYVEGERDADRLYSLGFIATTNPGGAGKWRAEYAEALRRRRVVVLGDNDEPGRKHARDVHGGLVGAAELVTIVELPELPPKGDVTDWLDAGGTADELRQLIAEAFDAEGQEVEHGAEAEETAATRTSARDESAASILLALAADAELFHSPVDEPFATITVGGHRETHPVRARSFGGWLRQRYFRATDSAVAEAAVSDAVETLAARALFDGAAVPVETRVAEYEGRIYVDLANAAWEAVEIDAAGWRIVTDPSVRFRRPSTMNPLPTPIRGGTLESLRRFVNAPRDDDWRLLVGSMVAAFRPAGPYFVLILTGEQGTAKSTTSRVFRELIDPSQSSLRSAPRDQRDLLIAAKNNRVLAFDNLSRVPDWFSDALCRLSTGGGWSARQLYTDEDEVVLEAQRPVILNGITEIATRGDLLDRALILEHPRIDDVARRSEAEFWASFSLEHPMLLGALFDAVSAALANEHDVALERMSRMADPTRWVTAAEPALGWPSGSFADAYRNNLQEGNLVALDASPIASPLRILVSRGGWRGTATELRAALGDIAGEDTQRQRDWPKSPRALTGALKRLAPNLRAEGIEWERPSRSGSARTHVIRMIPDATVTTVTTDIARATDGDGPAAAAPERHPEGPTVTRVRVPDDGDDGHDGRAGVGIDEPVAPGTHPLSQDEEFETWTA